MIVASLLDPRTKKTNLHVIDQLMPECRQENTHQRFASKRRNGWCQKRGRNFGFTQTKNPH